MKKALKSISARNLKQHLMATISKELGYVYFTSTGDVYAKLKDAEKHQAEINYTRESKQMIERRLLMSEENILAENILKILNENGWGVYYKSNPIHILGIKGGEPPIFTVNAVGDDILTDAINGNNKGDNKWHSETGLKQ